MIFETKHLTKTFGGLSATSDVSLQIQKGELVSIIGPNGAGKTTLFNLLTGHLSPDEGKVFSREEILPDFPPMRFPGWG
jgi:branched-chain amino acid transport system ATP-binding protein